MKALYYSRRYKTQASGVEPTLREGPKTASQRRFCEANGTCHDSGAGRTACNWDCVLASETNFRNLSGLHEVKRVIRI